MNLPEFPQILRRYAVKAPGHNQNANQNKAIGFRISSGWLGAKVMIYPEILVNGKWIKVVHDGQALVCELSRMLSSTREFQVKQAFTEFMKEWFTLNNLTWKDSKNKKEKIIQITKALEEKKRKADKEAAKKFKKEQRAAEIASYKASSERVQNSGSGTRTH
jgi:hypothetical protein